RWGLRGRGCGPWGAPHPATTWPRARPPCRSARRPGRPGPITGTPGDPPGPRRRLQASPGMTATASAQQLATAEDRLGDFRPKDEADYLARVLGRVMAKSRRHETLARHFWGVGAGAGVPVLDHRAPGRPDAAAGGAGVADRGRGGEARAGQRWRRGRGE